MAIGLVPFWISFSDFLSVCLSVNQSVCVSRCALLKAAKEAAPLCASVNDAHSLGILYPTDLESLVEKNNPDLAALVPCP